MKPTDDSNPNAKLLDRAATLWFHARKSRPIWVRRLERPECVRTLEGEEHVPAGTCLCRGEAGDLWPQSPERLEAKYIPTENVVDGWQKYVPHPDNSGVLAARIDRPFEVSARWGQLKGKSGDFLVKTFEDRDVRYPADVWIVDAALFEATYERVTAPL